MLKNLYKDDTTVTPYVTTKDWQLSNIDNTDLVLSEAGNPIEAENVIYTLDAIIIDNSDCAVAKEHQSLDLATFREGLKITGIFYPDTDPTNLDGTYKRMVYTQVKTTFYNNYRDPTKMWGLEKIDFDSSNTKKFLTDSIKVLDVPTDIMGEKMIEGTIDITDNSIDDIHTITDDGENNLFAGTNLFSKKQELGNFINQFFSGSIHSCDAYFNTIESPEIPINLSVISGSAILTWESRSNNQNFFNIQRSLDGNVYVNFDTSVSGTYTDTTVTSSVGGSTYWYRVSAINEFGTSSFSNTAVITFSE